MSEKAKDPRVFKVSRTPYQFFWKLTIEQLKQGFIKGREENMSQADKEVELGRLLLKHRELSVSVGYRLADSKHHAIQPDTELLGMLDLIENEIMHLMRDGAEAPKAVTK